jgi:hypothetical protein
MTDYLLHLSILKRNKTVAKYFLSKDGKNHCENDTLAGISSAGDVCLKNSMAAQVFTVK